MYKKIKLVILFFMIGFASIAQTLNLSDKIPLDQEIRKGVLPNGMTYYIQKTDVTKDVASYYIIQNVGSVLEKDNQQGLAHFLEHMAFNGTKNFPGKGVLNKMQEHGLIFGRDINAYTGFDETVYNINNIPTTPDLIDTGLLILHDWANDLLLTEEEIDAERGVIKEEWRTRQSGGMRVLQKNLPVRTNNTIYASRLPIGSMDVVENFEYKALRDFYHDWYRTDLQAIAIIGDIDVDQIENKIKSLFSKIPAVKNSIERIKLDIPGNEEFQYSIAMDEEVTTSSVSFSIRHPKEAPNGTVGDLKKSLVTSLMNSMLSTRLGEISRKPDAPFLSANARYGGNGLARNANEFSIIVRPKENLQKEAFTAALTEVIRAVKFGFTNAEIERTIIQINKSYENQINQKDDRQHFRLIRPITVNYLEDEPLTDLVKEAEIAKKILSSLKADEIHNELKRLYTPNNRYAILTGVKGNKNLSKEDVTSIIESVETDQSLKAYTDDFSGKTLITGLDIKNGTITSEDKIGAIDATTFTLSNGIKVHYKFADKTKNNVRLRALSNGGTSLLSDDQISSTLIIGQVVGSFYGLGNYSSTELPKVTAGKTASANINISALEESINGFSVTSDVETMLQMVHLRFVKPRFDKEGHDVFMNNVNNFLIRKSENINSKIQDSITVAIYGKDNPRQHIFDTEYAKGITFEKVKEIYMQRFGDAGDFEFFIVGDVQKEALKPLLEKYIASIPTGNTKEEWKDKTVPWVSNKIDKDIFLKMEDPKSQIRIRYETDYEYNLKNLYIARTLGGILQLRVTETARESEGGAYSPSGFASLSQKPKGRASITVGFDCNPDKVEDLVTLMHGEIQKFAKGDIKQEDLDKTLASFAKNRKESKEKNNYDFSLLQNFVREGYNMNDPKNFDDIIKSITAKDVQKFAKKVLKKADTYEIVIKPL